MLKGFQLLTCEIALAGDIRNTVVRDRFEPITYPEYLVLMVSHGEHSITNIRDTGEIAMNSDGTIRDNEAERQRLISIYGKQIIAHCFPGAGASLPLGREGFAKADPLPVAEPAPAPAPAPEPAPLLEAIAAAEPARPEPIKKRA